MATQTQQVPSALVQVPTALAPLLTREPHGMRPANRRYLNGYIGEYVLADGHVVWCQWLPSSQTHTHIIVWDADEIVGEVESVCRLQAAAETEKLLVGLET